MTFWLGKQEGWTKISTCKSSSRHHTPRQPQEETKSATKFVHRARFVSCSSACLPTCSSSLCSKSTSSLPHLFADQLDVRWANVCRLEAASKSASLPLFIPSWASRKLPAATGSGPNWWIACKWMERSCKEEQGGATGGTQISAEQKPIHRPFSSHESLWCCCWCCYCAQFTCLEGRTRKKAASDSLVAWRRKTPTQTTTTTTQVRAGQYSGSGRDDKHSILSCTFETSSTWVLLKPEEE